MIETGTQRVEDGEAVGVDVDIAPVVQAAPPEPVRLADAARQAAPNRSFDIVIRSSLSVSGRGR